MPACEHAGDGDHLERRSRRLEAVEADARHGQDLAGGWLHRDDSAVLTAERGDRRALHRGRDARANGPAPGWAPRWRAREQRLRALLRAVRRPRFRAGGRRAPAPGRSPDDRARGHALRLPAPGDGRRESVRPLPPPRSPLPPAASCEQPLPGAPAGALAGFRPARSRRGPAASLAAAASCGGAAARPGAGRERRASATRRSGRLRCASLDRQLKLERQRAEQAGVHAHRHRHEAAAQRRGACPHTCTAVAVAVLSALS